MKKWEKEKFILGEFITTKSSLVTGSSKIILSSFLQRGVGLSRHFLISAVDKPVSNTVPATTISSSRATRPNLV